MANEERERWEKQLREAAAHVEEDVRRLVTYINDEVVPDIRKNGSQALRAAAEALQKLAQHMDDHKAAAGGVGTAPTSGPATPDKDAQRP